MATSYRDEPWRRVLAMSFEDELWNGDEQWRRAMETNDKAELKLSYGYERYGMSYGDEPWRRAMAMKKIWKRAMEKNYTCHKTFLRRYKVQVGKVG